MHIDSLTMNGLGRATDGSLHPRCLPGEVIDPDGPRILTPSPDRVAPPCRHFKTCGGCAMQHASDGFVAAWKEGIVSQALAGQGLSAPVAPILTSPPRSRRRAKLSARRTKKSALIGFHTRASGTIVETPDCTLLTPSLRALRPALEALTLALCSRTGEIAFTVTDSLEGADVVIDYPGTPSMDHRILLAGLAHEYGLARLCWGDEHIAQKAPPTQAMGRARVAPPPGAFLQATAHGQTELVRLVRDMTRGAATIADLFAGCGTFTLPLAETADVLAVEGDAAMLKALDAGWRTAPGLHRVTTLARDLFRRPLLPDDLGRFDAVVIDPPRQGAEAQIAEIAAARVPVVAMISCNPVTFARDARSLVAAGYAMGEVTPIDQFRWSPHVEMAARFAIS